MRRYCEFARSRPNVYLDTSAVWAYHQFGRAIRWAGEDKLTVVSDGFFFSPAVEKAKIDTLLSPTPYRTHLSRREYEGIMGGTMARLLK